MQRILLTTLLMLLLHVAAAEARKTKDTFPDGTPVDEWFRHDEPVTLDRLGEVWRLTDHGVQNDSTIVQTAAIQHVIDQAAASGQTAVVVVPRGTFVSGALQLRPHVNLWIEEGGMLRGSTDISDFPIVSTRIEGQTCAYFSALINADGIDSLTIAGHGIIDGNGLPYWRAFWLRRQWNPQCTNKDEQRPRLLYISHCSNVNISGLTLQNSPFWTTHLYRSHHVRLRDLRILSPASPVKAPSTDAVDIDACHDIHISRCYMAVNDDAVALKGGKGPYADTDENNGPNERIIIEDCEYGFCHSCLTCGSEAIRCRNIILRRIRVGKATRLLWLKMRPDTPQQYEHIAVEDITGDVTHFLYIRPWTQFFDLQGRTDMPLSTAHDIAMRRCDLHCQHYLNIEPSEQYRLSDFTLEDLRIRAEHADAAQPDIERLVSRNVHVEQATSSDTYLDTNEAGDVTPSR